VERRVERATRRRGVGEFRRVRGSRAHLDSGFDPGVVGLVEEESCLITSREKRKESARRCGGSRRSERTGAHYCHVGNTTERHERRQRQLSSYLHAYAQQYSPHPSNLLEEQLQRTTRLSQAPPSSLAGRGRAQSIYAPLEFSTSR